MVKLGGFTKAAIIALLVPIIPFVLIGELPGERWLSSTDENSLLFGASGAALLASDILIPVPSSLLGSLLGARLGMLQGFAWAWLGLVAGNLAGYLFGRLVLSRLISDTTRSGQVALCVLFVSRPVPVLAEAVTMTAGASGMSLRAFLLFAAAGNAVYALVMAASGATLLPDSLLGPGLAVPMLVPVLGWFIWRVSVRRGAASAE